MKKLVIKISLIMILLIGIVYLGNYNKIKLFERVDADRITEIHIRNPGASFNTNDKSQILEIMNYLKSLKLSKRSNKKLPNVTPDAEIALISKDGTVNSVAIYGDVARMYPEEEYPYTIPTSIYRDLEDLCKKYK